MATMSSHRKYISRIANTIRQIVIFQGIQAIIFISIINFGLFHPIVWLKSIIDRCTSSVCWLCFILNALLLFGLSVRYSKNYTIKYSQIISKFDKILKLFTANNQILVLASIIFGISNAYFHINLVNLSDAKDDEFITSLLSRKCMIICAGPYFALYYLTRHNFKDEIMQVPIIHQSIKKQLYSELKCLISQATKISLYSIPLYFILYSIFGYKILELWSILFDAENNFDLFECFDKNVIIYLFLFGTSFYFTLLVMHELFKLNLMQPMVFPIDLENSSENEILLINGLKSENSLIRILAFQDLYILTERYPDRRREIFAITFPGGQGKNWNEISTACKSVIENFIDGLMRTYPKLTSSKMSIDYTSNRNKRANLDHLLNSASFRAYPKEVLTDKDPIAPKTSLKDYIVRKVTNNRLIIYLFGDQNLLEFKRVIAESQIVMWINLSFTTLLKMALIEDQYGVTQNDVPKILELMLRLQDTLSTINKIRIYKILAEKDNLYVTLITSLEVNIRSCIYVLNYIYKPYFGKMQLDDDIREKLAYYSL